MTQYAEALHLATVEEAEIPHLFDAPHNPEPSPRLGYFILKRMGGIWSVRIHWAGRAAPDLTEMLQALGAPAQTPVEYFAAGSVRATWAA